MGNGWQLRRLAGFVCIVGVIGKPYAFFPVTNVCTKSPLPLMVNYWLLAAYRGRCIFGICQVICWLTSFTIPNMSNKDHVRGLAFSPQNDQLVVGGSKGVAHLYQIVSDSVPNKIELIHQYQLEGSKTLIEAMVFSPDGSQIVGCDFSGQISLWNSANGALEKSLNFALGPVHDIRFTADGESVLFGGDNGLIYQWQLTDETPEQIEPPQGYWGRISSLALTATGDQVLSATRNGKLSLTHLMNGEHIPLTYPSAPPAGRTGHAISSLTMTPDDDYVGGIIQGGRIFVQSVANHDEAVVIDEHHYSVRGLAFTPANDKLWVGKGLRLVSQPCGILKLSKPNKF